MCDWVCLVDQVWAIQPWRHTIRCSFNSEVENSVSKCINIGVGIAVESHNKLFSVLSTRQVLHKLLNNTFSSCANDWLIVDKDMLRLWQTVESLNPWFWSIRGCKPSQSKSKQDNQTRQDRLIKDGLFVTSVILEASQQNCSENIQKRRIKLLLIVSQVKFWSLSLLWKFGLINWWLCTLNRGSLTLWSAFFVRLSIWKIIFTFELCGRIWTDWKSILGVLVDQRISAWLAWCKLSLGFLNLNLRLFDIGSVWDFITWDICTRVFLVTDPQKHFFEGRDGDSVGENVQLFELFVEVFEKVSKLTRKMLGNPNRHFLLDFWL